MNLLALIRPAALIGVAALLAACATTQNATDDPKEWSYSTAVEARKFYASGLTVPGYLAQKSNGSNPGVYVYYLCSGLVEAGDEVRANECRREYEKAASRPENKSLKQTFDEYRVYLDIAFSQLSLEQGRFEEVKAKLQPFMQGDAALVTFDRSKEMLAKYRMVAALTLARAQRATGGLSPEVRAYLEETNVGLNVLGALMNPRGMAAYRAERKYLLGKYGECYDELPRSSAGGVGLLNVVSIEGSAAAMDRILAVTSTRLQALCAYEAGRLEDAKLSYEDLLKVPEVQAMRGTKRLAHYHLAQIALRQNRGDDALAHLRQAVDALESERAAIDSEAGRLGYVTNKGDVYAQLVQLLVERGRDAEAFEYAERGKARALVDMLASKRNGAGRGADGIYTRALRAVDEAESAAQAPQATRTAAVGRGLAVRQEIARANPQLGSLLSVSALPADEARKALRPQETLIEYFGEGDRLFAFVVTQKGVKAVRLDAKAVARHGRAYRAVLTERSSRDYLAASKRLYDAVFAPLLAHADTGPVTIVPHGTLHYVPFAALHDGRSYLVQKSDVRLLPSASVLPFLTPRAAGGNSLLILGNPDLGNPQLDLPGAEQEARLLERMNKGAQVLLRRNASETALRRLGQQFREIHFAMHGKFDSQNAMASGLYMARDAENDGILSVGELYDMQLNADLVVLSACETALGDVSHGDDMVGLNRGFLFAGARSIVSSLWEVDDQATRDLMVAFYQQREKYGKAGGLRQAQLAVMKKYPHPYYWAAFQMSGLF